MKLLRNEKLGNFRRRAYRHAHTRPQFIRINISFFHIVFIIIVTTLLKATTLAHSRTTHSSSFTG